MKTTLFRASLLSAGILCAFSQTAAAKVSAEEAARLGKDLTCSGAEKAGNADGSIPEFSGKWLGAPDHIKHEGTGKFWENPYASE